MQRLWGLAGCLIFFDHNPETIDRSGSALQVLGTPTDAVIFTSFDDESVGIDTDPLPQTPDSGDWGGLLFQNDLDRENGRFIYEEQGVFRWRHFVSPLIN